MESFSPTHWVLAAVIGAALLYAVVKAIIGLVKFNDWRRDRAARKAKIKSSTRS